MRMIPRFSLVRLKAFNRRLRRWTRHLTIARSVYLTETLVFAGALVFALTGRRVAIADRYGPRGDLVLLAAGIALCVVIHLTLSRRVIELLKRRFAPPAYDERRILFDLGQEARAAASVDQLYQSIVDKIRAALRAENLSIFVRDDLTGNYVCRISAPQDAIAPAPASNGNGQHATKSELALAGDSFIITRLRNLRNPLDITPQDFDTWHRAWSVAPDRVREARERECATLERIRSRLLLQIRIKEQLIGILSLGGRSGHHQYSTADKEMLMAVAGQLAFVIENSRLIERMVAEERLRRELALAAEVQQRLLPDHPPSSARLELAGACHPARGVGGDYYDFIALGGERIGVAVADVSGKGISAALVMSNVQAALRSQTMALNGSARAQGTLVEIMARMNRLLCGSTGDSTYVTFFYAEFDEQSGLLTYVNAGHNPPFLLRANEVAASAGVRCDQLTTGGMAIGMFEFGHYQQETVQMRSGDLLAAFTDGVTEALNTAGEEFGEARLQDLLASVAHLSANEVRDQVMQRLQAWCAGAPQHDDMTLIVVKVR
ncbi:MAG TPA: SpoIIE family protein phosphatase [Blastocatellia bacterium]|nr:SpoIIE family protein phosphatase [Blastocatellia bacterium]